MSSGVKLTSFNLCSNENNIYKPYPCFHFSFFVTVIQRQVYPPADFQEETSDTINEERTPESSVIELIKEKNCFNPLKMIDLINDIDFRDKFVGTMLMYSSF